MVSPRVSAPFWDGESIGLYDDADDIFSSLTGLVCLDPISCFIFFDFVAIWLYICCVSSLFLFFVSLQPNTEPLQCILM